MSLQGGHGAKAVLHHCNLPVIKSVKDAEAKVSGVPDALAPPDQRDMVRATMI